MEDAVSEFIVSTCRVLPRANTNVFESVTSVNPKDTEAHLVVCGSCAEFFIQPLHSCFGDVDFFEVKTHSLAFAHEKPVLPDDLRHIDDPIDCLFMEPYLVYPGFVQLRHFGQIRYNWEKKTFELIQANLQRIMNTTEMEENDSADKNGIFCKVGPAKRGNFFNMASRKVDIVESIWCPQWPNEAALWTTRHREHGWPTTALIHEVVQNGCHVVLAKHPACRNDIHQFRLSFSVAEVILLQSWTPIQQIVYHMLRFFAKRELIKKNCPKEDEVLSTYHFKTLVLWSCEEMSPDWWSSSSVVELCSNLLKKLAKWLEDGKCPNYFICKANLLHEQFNRKFVDQTVKNLIYYNESDILSLWFVEHYMQPSYLDAFDAKCTQNILSRKYLEQTLEAIKAIYPISIDYYFSKRLWCDLESIYGIIENHKYINLTCDFLKYSLRIDSPIEGNLNFLPALEYESCYWFYGSMLRLLQAAHLLQMKGNHFDAVWFFKLIRTVSKKAKPIRSKHHSLPRQFDDDVAGSQFLFLKAQELMETLTGSSDELEFQAMSEISKGIIMKALHYKDHNRNSIARVSLSYLA